LEPRDAFAKRLRGRSPGPAGGPGPVGGAGPAPFSLPGRTADLAAGDEIRRKIESFRLALARSGAHDAARFGPAPDRGIPDARPATTEDIEGAEEIASAEGRCLLIEKDLKACPSLEALSQAYRVVAGTERAAGGLAFLDLETTGLSATPLFLAGMLVERTGGLRAVQLLARDYSEERCLIDILDGILGDARVCVTFNGKSFDLPYLRERAKYHRLPLRAEPEQLDLLHHARRQWKHHLPDCRLSTLEWYILGRRRMGDIGGWEVPCIYHEFVHTKDATRLKGVLRHNLMDVLAMAELLVSLAEAR
jgi:uncharacterized protein YprB with RNaseH-like and TPR domain